MVGIVQGLIMILELKIRKNLWFPISPETNLNLKKILVNLLKMRRILTLVSNHNGFVAVCRVANLYWSSDAIPAIQIMPFYAFFCKIENYAVLFHS